MNDVVVVGGGYAGTLVAQGLDVEASVTLIDPRDAFVNVSSSMRAMVREEWSVRPFFGYGTLLRYGRVVRDTVVSADPSGVDLASGRRIDADYLVLASGSSHAYPARPRTTSTDAAQAAADLEATGRELARAGRVLILGAGPVGLELAGEIRDAWPEKRITLVDRSSELLPAYLAEVRADLIRQLRELDIDLRLGTTLVLPPAVPDGVAETFTVTTTAGEQLTADIWFQSFGSRPHTSYLEDRMVQLTPRGTVPVDEHLNVVGQSTVYALGDIADLTDPKMATWAQTQAPTVIANIRAQLRGEHPSAVYEPATVQRILLPLGDRAGVGQLPAPDGGAMAAPLEVVIERKGRDLFFSRFAERFGAAEPAASA